MAGVAGRSGGRNAKTSQEHELAGTVRTNRHDFDSPSPPKIKPSPPKELEADALAEWEAMIGRLEVSGTLTLVDDAAIYQYCRLYAETEEIAIDRQHLEAAVDRLEENLGDLKGEDFVKLVQELTQQRKLISKCTDQLRSGRLALRAYLVEFGMTPAARSRVKLPKGATVQKSKWDGVLPA